MVRGVAGRVKAFLPFCLFTLLPLNIHAQQISAKNEVIDCGSVVYEQPVTAKFELQSLGYQECENLLRMYDGGISQRTDCPW